MVNSPNRSAEVERNLTLRRLAVWAIAASLLNPIVLPHLLQLRIHVCLWSLGVRFRTPTSANELIYALRTGRVNERGIKPDTMV